MFKNITHKINSSINSKFIFAFVFCLIIPLLFLESLFSYQFRKILMNKEVQYMSDKISISSSQLNNVLKDMNDIVNSLILNSDFMNIMVSEEKIPTYEWFQEFKWMQNILNSLATKNNVIYSITVIGSDNKQYKSSSNYNNNLSIDSALVKRILDAKGEVVLLNRYLEGIDDNDTITLGKAIKKFNQIVGVILVDAPPDAIDSALNIFNENEGAVYILNKDKYVLFTTDKNISSSILPDELAKSLNSYRTTLQTENKEYLYLVEESNETPCAIVVLIPKKDDDILTLNKLRSLIDWNKHGYEIVGQAMNGEDAIKLVDKFHPDIVLLDINMPKKNGVEVTKEIYEHFNRVYILVLSNYDDFEFVRATMKYGVYDYILKDQLTPDLLLQKLKEIDDLQIKENISNSRMNYFATIAKQHYLKNLVLNGVTDTQQHQLMQTQKEFCSSSNIMVVAQIVNFSLLTYFNKRLNPESNPEKMIDSIINLSSNIFSSINNGIITHVENGVFVLLFNFENYTSFQNSLGKVASIKSP